MSSYACCGVLYPRVSCPGVAGLRPPDVLPSPHHGVIDRIHRDSADFQAFAHPAAAGFTQRNIRAQCFQPIRRSPYKLQAPSSPGHSEQCMIAFFSDVCAKPPAERTISRLFRDAANIANLCAERIFLIGIAFPAKYRLLRRPGSSFRPSIDGRGITLSPSR